MQTNLQKYKAELAELVRRGTLLSIALELKHREGDVKGAYEKAYGKEDFAKLVKQLPIFSSDYQSWYSEAQAVIKQLLPDRLADFVRHYEKPKTRREITYANYVIDDCLRGLNVRFGGEKVVGPDAAITQFEQQLSILKSAERRLESSLFDIRQLVQADLFDSELEAAVELLTNGFTRAAGALAGVVLEKQLGQVCSNHNVKSSKKDPAVADLNDALKANNVIDTPQWRAIQHLGDIRNLCDHNKKREPTANEVTDLIAGVDKLTKTLF